MQIEISRIKVNDNNSYRLNKTTGSLLGMTNVKKHSKPKNL